MTSTHIPQEAADLLALIVQHNTDSATHTHEWLMAAERQESRRLAEALVGMVDALSHIPMMQRTVYVDWVIGNAWGDYQRAKDILARKDDE